jgi:NAD+ kinase
MSQFRTIGLVGRLGSEQAQTSLHRLIAFLKKANIDILLDDEIAASMPDAGVRTAHREELADTCDLVIVVGGDGSLLSAARVMVRTGVPILGINRGRLGFLTDIKPDEIEEKVGEVLAGDFLTEPRFLLTSTVYRGGKPIASGDALNDVVIHPGQLIRMIDFELYIDGEFVYRQRSDGLIISTPTGSTAYALSGGGPIMHPKLDAIVLVPLNPHTLSSRPIVVDGSSEIRLLVVATNLVQPHVTCDGQNHVITQAGDEVVIRKKPEILRLIHPPNHNFYEICRTKLGWASHGGE